MIKQHRGSKKSRDWSKCVSLTALAAASMFFFFFFFFFWPKRWPMFSGITVVEESTMEDIFHSHSLNEAFGTISITTKKPMLKGLKYIISFQEFTYPLRTDFVGFFYTWYERNGEKV